ncbi:hypothetical protein ACFL6I_13005 [candidate division KSB1 bacterium]
MKPEIINLPDYKEVVKMSSDYNGQISGTFPSIKSTRVRYIVKDKVKAQVIDTERDKVIREIPNKLSSNIFKSVYA